MQPVASAPPAPKIIVPDAPKVHVHQAYTMRDAPERTGDCWRTGIAILLGLHRDDVPDFVWESRTSANEDPDHRDRAHAWLAERGWQLEYLHLDDVMRGMGLPDHGWLLAGGLTERSLHHWTHDEPWAHHYRELLGDQPILHTVVMRHDLRAFIDPLEGGTGLTHIVGFELIYREQDA